MNANLEEAAKEWLAHESGVGLGATQEDYAEAEASNLASLTALLQKVAFEGFRAGQAAGPNASPEPTPPIETA